jgi:hypothetical protein
MRKITLIFILVSYSLIAQVGIGTSSIDNSAILEVSSTDQGILMPQIALISTTDSSTIITPEDGLIVYNTNAQNDITPGYYYWFNNSWVRLLTAQYEEPSIKCRNVQQTDINDYIDAPLFDDTAWNDDATLYEVSGNRIIVKENGEYSVQVSIHFVGPKQMVSPEAQISVNGSVTGAIAASGAQETVGFGDPGGTLIINEILSLSTNDEIGVRMSRGSNNTEDKELELLGGVGSSYILVTKIN